MNDVPQTNGLGFLIARSITVPLARTVQVMKAVAAGGDVVEAAAADLKFCRRSSDRALCVAASNVTGMLVWAR